MNYFCLTIKIVREILDVVISVGRCIIYFQFILPFDFCIFQFEIQIRTKNNDAQIFNYMKQTSEQIY